jgi:hypothetical protein
MEKAETENEGANSGLLVLRKAQAHANGGAVVLHLRCLLTEGNTECDCFTTLGKENAPRVNVGSMRLAFGRLLNDDAF